MYDGREREVRLDCDSMNSLGDFHDEDSKCPILGVPSSKLQILQQCYKYKLNNQAELGSPILRQRRARREPDLDRGADVRTTKTEKIYKNTKNTWNF
jgi:hypothetical protein